MMFDPDHWLDLHSDHGPELPICLGLMTPHDAGRTAVSDSIACAMRVMALEATA